MNTILFLCTGNYYRSRFAEELFNHHAARQALAWRACSRALAIERGKGNVGAVSVLALEALHARGCLPQGADRMPQSCTHADLQSADLAIALKESEHRPLMRSRFPEWESRVEYWFVDDVDVSPPHVALREIERGVERLLEKLKKD